MSEKEKSEIQKEKPKAVSRRNFLKVAGVSAAVGIVAAVPGAKKALSATPSNKLKMEAEEIYKCQKGLRRFLTKNEAFKKLAEDLGKFWPKLVIDNMVKNVKMSKIGEKLSVKDVKEARAHLALWSGTALWDMLSQPFGEGEENKGFLSWKPINVLPMFRGNPEPNPDPVDLTKKVKQMAYYVGANRVGIAKINQKWVYEETCRNVNAPEKAITKKIVFRNVKEPKETKTELIIPDTIKYAVVSIIDMNRLTEQVGPGASIDSEIASNVGYSRTGITDIALAEAIRTLGYHAIPCKNSTALSIPLAIDAGLGQLGRNGLLITPDYGPSVKICKVLTDMPLVPDKPIDFGVTEFCDKCKKCAEKCPAKAISFTERTYEPPVETGNPGALKWYINGKKCLQYWIDAGAACCTCQAVCPYTKGSFWGHDVMRGLVKNVPSLNPIMKPMDDLFGYGNMRDPELIWKMKIGPFGIDPTKEI